MHFNHTFEINVCLCNVGSFINQVNLFSQIEWMLLFPQQVYPCSSDKECSVGSYCHSPQQAPSRCLTCRRRKKRCHRDAMCCPGNRCSNCMYPTHKHNVNASQFHLFCDCRVQFRNWMSCLMQIFWNKSDLFQVTEQTVPQYVAQRLSEGTNASK